jgi:hypothetical protein
MWLKVGGFALVAGFLGLLIWLYGGSRYKTGRADEAAAWQGEVAKAERRIADLRVANERLVAEGLSKYVERIEVIKPVAIRSKETVVRYAQTPAGAAQCLAPERVRGIEQDRAALFPALAQPASSGTPAVPADGAPQER